ncbi:MAG TPA: mechanosensitive ion channel family protein [Vicinamibacterales bacterium]
MFARLFDVPIDWRLLLLALVPTLVAAWVLSRLARRLAAAALRSIVRDTLAPTSPLVRAPLRLISAAVFILVVGVALFPAFEMAGMHPRTGLHLRALADWAFGPGLRVVLIGALAHALVRMTALLVKRFEHEVNQGTALDAMERAKRARTLGAVVQNVTTALITGIAALMILTQFKIDITPVLTGAGIAGIAVGFGAQTLVRDILSGFFLILENQVRVGDVAAINGTGGLVEAINLRTIVLRDEEGTVHVFPNGAITTLANRSKDFAYYVIAVGISYEEEPARVEGVLREVGAELQKDPKFAPSILAPIEIMGVDGFDASSVRMKLRIKTMPLKQWEVGRELRRRMLAAFAENRIEIPYPVQVDIVKSQ